MRERVRVFLAAFLYYSGVVRLTHWWIRRFQRRLIILNYHSAVGEHLRSQLLYLRRHYRIMHLEDALEEWYTPSQTRDGDARLPLVLTFDDGYLDNYTRGVELARELQIPFTVFLVPGYTESGHYFWWLAAEYLVQHTHMDKVTIEGNSYQPALPADRKALMHAIDAHVRHAASIAEREAFLADLQSAFDIPLPRRMPTKDDDGLLPLTWNEIHEMEQSGWVSFGAHTMHHPVLAYLSDATEIEQEVGLSRQVLEQHLGHPVRTFAYPIGKPEHFGNQGLHAVKIAGYTWALTTIEETNTPHTDPHLLCRLPGDVEQHWLVMAAELVGLLGILSRFRKK